jgi:cell division protein FtsL
LAAYMHGNLAVKEKQSEQQRTAVRETRRIVARPKTLPAGEKLLLLLLVVVFVFMAGVVVWRYTLIYNMNNQVAKIQSSIHDMETENSMLKQQIDKLGNPENLQKDAAQWGFVPLSDGQIVAIQPKAVQSKNVQAKAEAPKTAQAKTAQTKPEMTKTEKTKAESTKPVQSKSAPAPAKTKEAEALAKR